MYLDHVQETLLENGFTEKKDIYSFQKDGENGYVLIQKLGWGQFVVQLYKQPFPLIVKDFEKTDSVENACAIAEKYLDTLKSK